MGYSEEKTSELCLRVKSYNRYRMTVMICLWCNKLLVCFDYSMRFTTTSLWTGRMKTTIHWWLARKTDIAMCSLLGKVDRLGERRMVKEKIAIIYWDEWIEWLPPFPFWYLFSFSLCPVLFSAFQHRVPMHFMLHESERNLHRGNHRLSLSVRICRNWNSGQGRYLFLMTSHSVFKCHQKWSERDW